MKVERGSWASKGASYHNTTYPLLAQPLACSPESPPKEPFTLSSPETLEETGYMPLPLLHSKNTKQ